MRQETGDRRQVTGHSVLGGACQASGTQVSESASPRPLSHARLSTPGASRQPLVSVIASCYNHSRFVVECLESIRQQTYPHVQLIIIDDCSRDDSVAVIQHWIAEHGVQCKFLTHAKNQGVCRSYNDALAHATGDYVAIISTDDIWLPRKLEEQVKLLESLPPEYGVVYSDASRVDEQGNSLPGMYIDTDGSAQGYPEGDVFDHLLKGNWLAVMAALIRRSCFEVVGGFDESLPLEDYDMWLRIAKRYRFAFSPYVSARYRIVGNSHIRTLGMRMIESHLMMFLKWFGESSERDRVIRTHMTHYFREMYRRNHPERHRYFRSALARVPSRKLRVLAACSRFAVPYGVYEKIERCLQPWLDW